MLHGRGLASSSAPTRRVLKRQKILAKSNEGTGASRLLKGTLRVFTVSDLHTHHHENLNWVRQLSTTAHQQDVLIVAGDISDDLNDLRVALSALQQRFAVVFFCPGNHELWVKGRQQRPPEGPVEARVVPEAAGPAAGGASQELRSWGEPQSKRDGGDAACKSTPAAEQQQQHYDHPCPNAQPTPVRDSLEKLAEVMALCEHLEVRTTPARLGRLRIVPLLAWHHKSFDTEPDIPGIPKASQLTISDYARCVWPSRMVSELEACWRFESCPEVVEQQQQQWRRWRQIGIRRGSINNNQQSVHAVDLSRASGGSPLATSSGDSPAGVGGGPAGIGADWGSGGHGSGAVAAWLDALNDEPGNCSCDSRSSSSPNTPKGRCSATSGDTIDSSYVRSEPSVIRNRGSTNNVAVRDSAAATYQSEDRPWDRLTELQGGGRGVAFPQIQISGHTLGTRQRLRNPGQQNPGNQQHEVHAPVTACEDGCGESGEDVISFSHFLPLHELLPEKRYLTFPNLAKAVGSTYLAERVRRLRPHMHVFGHTHFAWDAVHDGIRYVQAPLAYPSERRFRLRSLFMTAAPAPAGQQSGLGGGGDAGGGDDDSTAAAATANDPAPSSETAASTSLSRQNSADQPSVGRGLEDPANDDGPDLRGDLDSLMGRTTITSHPQHPRDEQLAAEKRLGAATAAATGGLSRKLSFSPPGSGLSQARQRSEVMDENSSEPAGGKPPPVESWQEEKECQGDGQQGLMAPWPSSLDPGDARWLPLCVYRAQYTVRLCLKAADSDVTGGRNNSRSNAALAMKSIPLLPAAELLLRADRKDTGAVGGTWAANSGSDDGFEGALEVEVLEWQSQWCPEQAAMWSSYYKSNPRRPQELQLAPWVAERYSRRLRRSAGKEPPLSGLAAGTTATQLAAVTSAMAAAAPSSTACNGGTSSGTPGSSRVSSGSSSVLEDRVGSMLSRETGPGHPEVPACSDSDCGSNGPEARSELRRRAHDMVVTAMSDGMASKDEVEETELE